VNWYADVGTWGMLGNDSVGDCVPAAIMHCLQQISTYAGKPLNPSDDEAIALYSAVTGYNPDDPASDQGTYVMGPGGAMEWWHTHGVTCGGKQCKLESYLQITRINPTEWRQAIAIFGGILVGLSLPANVLASGLPPFLWNNPGGPVDGGHEVWVNGFTTTSHGYRTYDTVSWGGRYRLTEDFLEKTVAEVVVPYSPEAMNAMGTDGAGVNHDALVAAMASLKQSDHGPHAKA
jgi:hypothetical protein